MVDAGGQHAVMLAYDPTVSDQQSTVASGKEEALEEQPKESAKNDTEKAAPVTDSDKATPAEPSQPDNSTEKPAVTEERATPMDTQESNGLVNGAEKEKPAIETLGAPPAPPPPTATTTEVASTAGATVNSSSLHSCSLVASSDQSSLSSAHSTEGSNRQGAQFAQPAAADAPKPVTPACGSTSTSEPGFPLTDGTASPADTH